MRLLTVFICFLCIGMSAKAQNLFKREAKLPLPNRAETFAIAPHAAITVPTDSTFNVARFVVIPASYNYSASGSGANVGGGLFLQHQNYNYSTQLYTVKWEAGLAVFGGINQPTPKDLTAIATIAIMGGAPIQGVPILVGPGWILNAPPGKHLCAQISAAIHFNN